jgi:spermidine/putrescine transport system permease protein
MTGVVDPATIDALAGDVPGHGRAAQPRWYRRHRVPWLGIYSVFAFLYLFLPIIWIVVFSFNDPGQKFNLLWKQFTLDNWAHPFQDSGLTQAFIKSLEVAAISVSIAVLLGTLMALALARYRFRGSAGMDIFLVIPLTTPEVVMGASLLTLFLGWSVAQGFWTIVIAHIMFCVSFVALTVKARIRGFDWTLEDAAMDLGATPLRTFWRITFPLILPGILAAALLSFALSIDDYIITSFVAGSEKTFPIQIYTASRTEISPQINVLATIILGVSVILLIMSSIWSARRASR